jgi:hypothetical protein
VNEVAHELAKIGALCTSGMINLWESVILANIVVLVMGDLPNN